MNTSKQPEENETVLTDEDATKSTTPSTPPGNSAPTDLICSFCDTKLPLDKYKKCNCKTTIYCRNASCQKEHWKVHKTEHRKLCKALNAVKNEGEEEDDTKSGSKNKTSSPSIQASKPIIQKEEKDECPICLGELSTDMSTFVRFTCCGKGLHKHCAKQLQEVKSKNIREYCPLCRTKNPTHKEGVKQLQKWVKKKKAWAQCTLGSFYENGNGVKKDVKRAFNLYTLAADQGDANAQCNLGAMYQNGECTKPDVKRAVELYTLAAEQGHAMAQSNLGVMYEHGQGVDKDEKRAVELYTLAAIGNPSAQFNLGNMYANGQGVDKDENRAVELYTLASEQGDDQAQFNLGVMYANGDGVDQSFTKAREWFTKSASQGDKKAINALKTLDEAEGRTTTPSSYVNSNTIFCSYCNKPEPTNTKFNKCKGCRSVSYCNRECQIKHWKTKPNGHKKQCKKLAAAFKKLNKKKEK